MFTGIVTDVGRIAAARPQGGGLRLAIEPGRPDAALRPGESIAVDGCCLTVVDPGPPFAAHLSPETLARTGGRERWRPGRRVNLERALAVGDRLGGHLVQGHVDGLLRLLGRRDLPDGSARFRVELPRGTAALVCEKGSIALDGVSLTVAALDGRAFEVALIPETLRATTLGERRPGDRLAVEYDVLAKYVDRALQAHVASGRPAPAGPR